MKQTITCSAMNNEYEFICLASGSTGNAFVIKIPNDDKPTCILWECGLKDIELVMKLREHNMSIEDIDLCLISHNHKDHSLASQTITNLQIPILSCESVLNRLKTLNNKALRHNDTIGIRKNLLIYAFNVYHDVESLGFAIIDKTNNIKTLLMNDTTYFELTPQIAKTKFDYIFIECNHIKNQLMAIMNSKLNENEKFKYERQAKTHLSLYDTKRMLNQMDLTKVKGIFLTHFSKECCNDILCKTELEREYKKKIIICKNKGGFC